MPVEKDNIKENHGDIENKEKSEKLNSEEEKKENKKGLEKSEEDKKEEQTIEQILEAKVLKLEEDLKTSEDKYLRLYAEFENFKKRKNQEIATNNKYKSQDIISKLIPSIDNLERAISSVKENDENSQIIKGVKMVCEGVMHALSEEGVEVINPTGQEFDPNYHQAVLKEENKEKESNTILETFQKGYKLKDRIIRPAMVKVNVTEEK